MNNTIISEPFWRIAAEQMDIKKRRQGKLKL